jgi:hypothetical protein
MAEESKEKREEKPEGIQGEGWKVSDEEIDRVIKKLEEGWLGF